MIYINDPKQPYYKYDDIVDMVIEAGIAPKRAYIYLAAFGVRGELGRVMGVDNLDYSRPIKLAVQGDKLVTKARICTKCKGLIL